MGICDAHNDLHAGTPDCRHSVATIWGGAATVPLGTNLFNSLVLVLVLVPGDRGVEAAADKLTEWSSSFTRLRKLVAQF